MMVGVTVRKGKRADSAEFLNLVRGLARFEKLEPPDREAEKRILSDVFKKRRLGLFVAESGERLVGYALFYYSYSSFLARPNLYLEDIFVESRQRRKGIGGLLFRRCAEEAARSGCGRMEWTVLTWNSKAIDFYESIGARRLVEWATYRLEREQLIGVASGKGARGTG